MRPPIIRATARRLLAHALVLLAACQPATTGTLAGGATSTTNDKSSIINHAHLLMTANASSSTIAFKTNGTQKGAGTTYLGRLTNDTARWASASPLVSFEANNGGSTRFLSEGRLIAEGLAYDALYHGVIGSVDPNTQPQLLLAPFDTNTPPATKAHVRFAHLMPGVGPVDIWSGAPGSETKVASALVYGAITPYLDIQAATATVPSINVTVTPAGIAPGGANLISVVAITNVTNPGVYTIPLLYNNSNLSVATTKTLAIYVDR